MRYNTRSIIIGRKKDTTEDLKRPCFIAMFNFDNPHLKNEIPSKRLDFNNIHKIVINGLDINYLLPGNDLVINSLEYADIEEAGEHIIITGKQKKQ